MATGRYYYCTESVCETFTALLDLASLLVLGNVSLVTFHSEYLATLKQRHA